MGNIAPYKKDFNHNMHRRKRGHDYRAPWKYHITIGKDPSCPDFSRLVWRELTPEGVKVDYSQIGYEVWRGISRISEIEPKIQLYRYVIMPDHIHILLRVRERMEKVLGEVIHSFKSEITSSLRKIQGSPDFVVFTENYNDRIIYSHRNLNAVYDYIRQNPYRLAVRRERPDFFSKRRGLMVGEREVQGYGNLFLLRNPFKMALVVHRADTEEDFNRKLEDCLYFAANGGVVVSAFISAREKQIRREVEAAGGRVILVHDRPLLEREKPGKHDFELCCNGQLLMISPVSYLDLPRAEHPPRWQCLEMNKLAEEIAKN